MGGEGLEGREGGLVSRGVVGRLGASSWEAGCGISTSVSRQVGARLPHSPCNVTLWSDFLPVMHPLKRL